MRNLEAKVPADRWPAFKAQAWNCYTAASVGLAEILRDQVVATWQRELPTAVGCFLDDFGACIAHLKLPPAHRKAARTTNLLEQLFGQGSASALVKTRNSPVGLWRPEDESNVRPTP